MLRNDSSLQQTVHRTQKYLLASCINCESIVFVWRQINGDRLTIFLLSLKLTSRNWTAPVSPNSETEENAASGWINIWHKVISSLLNMAPMFEVFFFGWISDVGTVKS